MEHQNQILQTLGAPESQARLERIVSQEALNNRAAVGRRVCAEFGFVDARGSVQLAGCLKALNTLNTLHKARRIALPAAMDFSKRSCSTKRRTCRLTGCTR